MNLILVVLISLLLSLIFSLWFKKSLMLLLIIAISSLIILEILITKDIAAFYYRYYYHWLFLLPLLLVLPLGFIKERVKVSKLAIIIFLVWSVLVIRFPVITVINNIKYLNNDSTWFDSFSRKYAVKESNIYDYINLRYPKTKEIISWCADQKYMVDLYYSDPQLVALNDENGLHAFFINCNYHNLKPDEKQSFEDFAKSFIKQHPGAYYLSLESCQKESKNPFQDKFYSSRYDLNQKIVCSSKEIIPYLYILPTKMN